MRIAAESLRTDLDRLFGRKLVPLPLEEVRVTFKDLSRSAGNNLSKAKTKQDIKDECLPMQEEILAGDGVGTPPYRLAFRNHICKTGDPPKSRIIMVSPGELAFVEKRWAQPFTEALIASVHPRPWATGFSWFCDGGQEVLSRFDVHRTLSLDFSNFDLSSPTWFTRIVFDLIGDSFSMDKRDRSILDGICRNHMEAVATFGTRRYRLTGGIRTGSSFTHVIGTLTCILMLRYYFGPDVDSLSYGDDCLVNTRQPVWKVAKWYSENSTFVISPSKSVRGVHWLGLKLFRRSWILPDSRRRWAQLFFPDSQRNEDLVALMQSHLINCGNDSMRKDLRQILFDTGNVALAPGLREQLDFLKLTHAQCGENVLDLDDSLKSCFM